MPRRRQVAIGGGVLAGAAMLVTASTPIVNNLINRLWPDAKPVPILPVEQIDKVVPVESAAPVTSPHNGPSDRALPY
jgi:hypothetical protein